MNSTRKAHRLLLRGIAPLMLALSLPLTALAGPPAEAIQAGYTVSTFASDFTAQTVVNFFGSGTAFDQMWHR